MKLEIRKDGKHGQVLKTGTIEELRIFASQSFDILTAIDFVAMERKSGVVGTLLENGTFIGVVE